MRRYSFFSLLSGLFVVLSGCASVPPARGTAELDKTIAARGAAAAAWPRETGAPNLDAERAAALMHEPLSLEHSVELAFLRNAGIREAYAELGIAQANVLQASRLSNPTIGYIDLAPSGDGRSQITRSISLSFADLLLLPARTRLARGAFESTRERIGASLLDLQARVETAWFEYVNAQQFADMRAAVARAADNSAQYAQRLRDAGSIRPRNLALELAAASEAQVAAARARADVIRARTELAALMGVSTREEWQVPKRLPAPLAVDDPPAEVIERALETRLDVSAARRQVATLADAARVTRRWRWIGKVDVGYEWESETDGTRLRGPSLSVGVPIFNQNQGGVLRAQAELEGAQARLSGLELSVRNEVALSLDRLVAAREIAEAYRTALVPQREAVVLRTQEEFNFMLSGAFELLQAKREQFAAYQEYLDAVREYWVTRVELRRAVGGPLPGDEQQTLPTIGVDQVLAPEQGMKGMPGMEGMDSSHTDDHQKPHERPDTESPPHRDAEGEGS